MKTVYTVDYTGIGYPGKCRKVFTSLEAAQKFAKRDYADPVVVRNYSDRRAEQVINEAIMDEEFGG